MEFYPSKGSMEQEQEHIDYGTKKNIIREQNDRTIKLIFMSCFSL